MALLPRKKRCKGIPTSTVSQDHLGRNSPVGEVKFGEVGIFLVERRMGSSRRRFLTELARKKGFRVEEQMSESVTHVVSENNTGKEVLDLLEKRNGISRTGFTAALVDIAWFTESMGAGRPLEVESRHQLQIVLTPHGSIAGVFSRGKKKSVGEGRNQIYSGVVFLHVTREAVAVTEVSISSYACQRRTVLKNKNRLFTEALKVLAEAAELNESEGRYLAFSKASSILKSLPYTVTKMEDLQGIPSLGVHSRKVIKEILEDGTCSEVENILQNERYQTLKRFTSIFGVGVKTADKWYREGLRTLDELRASNVKLTREQEAGLLYHNDLSAPVTRTEADLIKQIVERAVHKFLPATVVTLTGGFRREKEFGHDVDLLITHPEEGKEEGLICQVINWMTTEGLILYGDITGNSYKGRSKDPGIFDHFEKCLSIFKLKKELVNNLESEKLSHCDSLAGDKTRGIDLADHTEAAQQVTVAAAGSKDWKAVRVDLVIAPYSQYAYALLGWTGSRLFERDLRRYAKHSKNMSLSSHSLFDNEQNIFLPAATEEGIFAHLGLEYIPPRERNA
ncbi:DNA-directed DNA/RNA polymerase mu isoform X1 [Pristis pectinata]|uniref:DNA-directed DNA/RNA polymerase mu isoform X1 n=1 Tax=Pristis pectinata TaxID=685728 RepID=UPI00223DF71A|nr:DNA-directed DNA/RNA polymerase mu isoform X1 [Pristis pectinata]XP_051896912.1 DNA-directed DNA/RNA polymerase mu isoform X1 [Pristis pectinata]